MSTENYSTKTKLSDILENGTGENLAKQWDQTQAAGDFELLPRGKYQCHVDGGELGTSTKGHPQYTLIFRVVDGSNKGRLLWHTLYLTPAALPMAKRDLGKLGVTALEQLENPLPGGRIRCAVTVGLRTNDDGVQWNRVRRFDVLGIDEPERDPFAPSDNATAPEPTDATTAAGVDSRFDFDAAASETKAPTDTATAAGGNGSVGGDDAVPVAPGATQEPDTAEGGGDATPF